MTEARTGAEVLAQVLAVLKRPPYPISARQVAAVQALDGCIVLTAEEAEKVQRAVSTMGLTSPTVIYADVLALLGGDND